MLKYLKSRHVSRAAIERFGIGYYAGNPLSKLHDRLLFPVRDQYGELIAFQGRNMADDDRAKYWHTPFEKSNILCGLYETAEWATQQGFSIITEGPLDITAAYDCGFPAVAGLGTAFSMAQAFLLRRYTDTALVWYDNDKAGSKAAQKVIPLLKEVGMKVLVPNIRLGEDVSDTWMRHGRSGIIRVIQGATYV